MASMWIKWEKIRIKRSGWYWIHENGSKYPQLVFAERGEQDWKLHTYDGNTHSISQIMKFCGPIDEPSYPASEIQSERLGFTVMNAVEEKKTAGLQRVNFFNVDL
jgi:hypothetical protein